MTTNDPYQGAPQEPHYPHDVQHPADANYTPPIGDAVPPADATYSPPVGDGVHPADAYYTPPAAEGGYAAPTAQYTPYPAYGGYYPPVPSAPQRRKRPWRLGAGIAALTAAALVGGIAIGDATSSTVTGSGSATTLVPTTPGGSGNSGGGSGVLPGSGGSGVLPGSGGSGTSGGGTSTSVTLANGKQKTGIVTIVSTLQYQNAQSAGTGMILTSNGEVLTNNHVVNGATSIVVTVASTGKSYRADVVGTAPSEDVAVLQLRNASGLQQANLGAASGVTVGDSVVGVGNAGGTGTLRASSGKVTALNRTITASDDGSGSNSEQLNGLIQVNAPIISGDSGGPLYDSAGQVVGMDTAASANPGTTQAYAIPIDAAVNIATQIETGNETSTIHIGLPAFLGVGVADSSGNGAAVTSLLGGGPAASAGVTDGSVITRVGSTQVTSAAGLKTALNKYNPGAKAKITWTDPAGTSHSATVTLGTGPAD
jgi:S1-C subfamily serine protease